MSAKRFKAETYKASSGVPIPNFGRLSPTLETSFSSMVSPTTATAAPSGEESSPSCSDEKIMSDLSDSERNSIINFSGAVEMQLFRMHPGRHRRLALHACYELMDKADNLTIPKLPENEKDWMNEKEMFLYKFLYVTAKARLYEIHREEATGSASRNTPLSRWYLRQCERQDGKIRGGPLDAVREILFDPSKLVTSRTDHLLRQAVIDVRPRKEAPNTSSSNAPQQTIIPKPQSAALQVTDTQIEAQLTTVEDRVRAKRKARLLRDEAQAAKDTSTNSQDETWRLRVADILWTHSRKVFHRHEKFASPKRRGKVSPCSFVVKDITQLLIDQSATMGTHLKRRQTVELMQELCREVPDWIRRSSAKKDDTSDWGPNDTVWIHPLDYQVVRDRLLGKSSESSAAMAPSTLLGKADTSKTDLSKVSSITEDAEKASKPIVKRSREDDRADVPAVTTLKDPEESPPHTKKIRSDTESPPHAKSPVAKKRRLRVNPHLIMTDADYQGGEQIMPSFNDSPRGLKSLFHQMNSGRRI